MSSRRKFRLRELAKDPSVPGGLLVAGSARADREIAAARRRDVDHRSPGMSHEQLSQEINQRLQPSDQTNYEIEAVAIA